MAFAAQWHTPHNRCVRFAPAVAGDHATLATGRPLRLTRTGLSPAGQRQLSWRTSNPFFLYAARWIASRSLSSGAHSRDPLARNDDKSKRTFATSRRDAPEALMNLSPLKGRGERRMPVAPAASCALGSGRTHTSIRVHRNHPTFPHAMVLTVSFVLPGDRACLPPSPADMSCLSPVGPT